MSPCYEDLLAFILGQVNCVLGIAAAGYVFSQNGIEHIEVYGCADHRIHRSDQELEVLAVTANVIYLETDLSICGHFETGIAEEPVVGCNGTESLIPRLGTCPE